jgi:hypothetical protein
MTEPRIFGVNRVSWLQAWEHIKKSREVKSYEPNDWLSFRNLLSFFPFPLQAVFCNFSKKLIKVYSISGDRLVISTFSFPLFGKEGEGEIL